MDLQVDLASAAGNKPHRGGAEDWPASNRSRSDGAGKDQGRASKVTATMSVCLCDMRVQECQCAFHEN